MAALALVLPSPASADDAPVRRNAVSALVEHLSTNAGVSRVEALSQLANSERASNATSSLKNHAPRWLTGTWLDTETQQQVIGVLPGTKRDLVERSLRDHGYGGDFVIKEQKINLNELVRSKTALASAAASRVDAIGGDAEFVSTSLDESANGWIVRISENHANAVSAIKDWIATESIPASVEVVEPGEFAVNQSACNGPHCDRPLRGAVAWGFGSGNSSNCSTGFFARSASYRYLITAGHCFGDLSVSKDTFAHAPTNPSPYWRSIGPMLPSLSNFGPRDHAAIRIGPSSFWYANSPAGFFTIGETISRREN